MVLDALSHMTMGSVSHIDEAKKDVVNDFHRFARLSVRLENSPNGSIMVNYDSKSYVVVELKPNKLLHQPLMELKESVLGKLNDSFSLGEGWCLEISRKVVSSEYRWFKEPDS